MIVQLALEGLGVQDQVLTIPGQVTELNTGEWEQNIQAHTVHGVTPGCPIQNADGLEAALIVSTLQLSTEYEEEKEVE